MLKFYNTLTRKKEVFKPIKKGEVKVYSCGPTVYAFAHIGNFRSYVFADILKRYLEYKGYKVTHIMNLTDIDDKTIRDSQKAKMSLKNFTQKYAKEFFNDVKTLNIKKASRYPRATENVRNMIKFTEVLEKKGYAYEKLHSVYFDISKFKNYGKLSGVDLKKVKAGARVDLDEYQKDAPGDFTLLKRSTLDELKRGIFYKTKWGNVRPGWHLECSVMSMKNLGDTLDIHTGGVDLIFPHHENEIAQSEAYSDKKFVNFWLHNEHLLINGQKMSKSLGNFYTLRDLLNKGYDWRALRYFLLSSHYKQKTNLTPEVLDSAKNTIERLQSFAKEMIEKSQIKFQSKNSKSIKDLLSKTEKYFEEAMNDDLNTPKALSVIFDFISQVNKLKSVDGQSARKILTIINKFDKVLGLNLTKIEKIEISSQIQNLVKEREQRRKEGNWKSADEIRQKIKDLGYWVEDTKKGPKIQKL